jgi:hypothetical protein
MADLLLAPAMAPFTFALALLMGLLALEVVALVLGGSLLGLGGDADIDLDADVGLDGDLGLDAPDLDAEVAVAPASGASFLTWLGLGAVPFILWVAALLAGFGLTGLIVQSVSQSTLGSMLPGVAALPIGLAGGVWFARTFGGVFSRLLPRDETQAVASSRLGGRRGVVTQGTARRGQAAEVRVTDRFGNTHYLRAEPLEDDAEIAQGADVLVIRQRTAPGDYRFRLMAVGDGA